MLSLWLKCTLCAESLGMSISLLMENEQLKEQRGLGWCLGAERPLYFSINPLPLNPFFLCVSVEPDPPTQSCFFLSTTGGGRAVWAPTHPEEKQSYRNPLNQGASWQTKYFQQTNVVMALELVFGSQLNIPPALHLKSLSCNWSLVKTQVDKNYSRRLIRFTSCCLKVCSLRVTDYVRLTIHPFSHTHFALYKTKFYYLNIQSSK